MGKHLYRTSRSWRDDTGLNFQIVDILGMRSGMWISFVLILLRTEQVGAERRKCRWVGSLG